MAGCFGNSPYDRSMEYQLYQHLDGEAKFEEYCQKVSECFDLTVWNTGMESFFENDRKVNDYLSLCFNEGKDFQYCANGIMELYKMHTI